GVERLHTRDRRAHVCLRSRHFSAAPEGKVRRDGDREQDADDDDHNEKLDEGEAPLAILLRDPLAEPLNHLVTPPCRAMGVRWLTRRYRPLARGRRPLEWGIFPWPFRRGASLPIAPGGGSPNGRPW